MHFGRCRGERTITVVSPVLSWLPSMRTKLTSSSSYGLRVGISVATARTSRVALTCGDSSRARGRRPAAGPYHRY